MNGEVKSAIRVLELLDLFGNYETPLSLKQIVAELGYPKSSAHALVQTLVSRGYVLQDSSERYLISDDAREGLRGISRNARLVMLARPVMDALRTAVGETVLFGVRNSRGDVRMIAKSVSENPVRYDMDLGRSGSSYCTATGRTLLAHMSEVAVDQYLSQVRLVAHTPFTITDRGKLKAMLAEIKHAGIAIGEQEFVLGSTGIAAPIFDRRQQVIAAINIAAITNRFNAARAEMIDAVKAAAEKLSSRLGAGLMD